MVSQQERKRPDGTGKETATLTLSLFCALQKRRKEWTHDPVNDMVRVAVTCRGAQAGHGGRALRQQHSKREVQRRPHVRQEGQAGRAGHQPQAVQQPQVHAGRRASRERDERGRRAAHGGRQRDAALRAEHAAGCQRQRAAPDACACAADA